MSKEKDTDNAPEQNASSASDDKEQRALKRNNYLTKLLLLVFVCQMGVVGYFAWEMKKISDVSDEPMKEHIATLAELYAEVNASIESLEKFSNALERKHSDIEARIFEAGESRIAEVQRATGDSVTAIDMSDYETELDDITIALGDVESMMEDVMARIEMLEHAPQESTDETRAALDTQVLDTLKEDIAALKTQIGTQSSGASAETLYMRRASTFALLEKRALSGETYRRALDQFAALYKEDEALDETVLNTLTNAADEGVSTLYELHTRFHARFDEVMLDVAATQTPDDDSVWSQLKHSASSLVAIRKVGGELSTNDPMDIMTRASNSLKSGDVSRAVQWVESLPEDSRSLFDGWLDDANQRIDIMDAVQDMQRLLDDELIALSNTQQAE